MIHFRRRKIIVGGDGCFFPARSPECSGPTPKLESSRLTVPSASVRKQEKTRHLDSYSTVLNREVEVIKMCHTDLRNSNTLTLDIIKRSPHLSVSPKT